MRNRPLVTPQRSALLAARAHGLRASATVSERKLWARLSGKQLGAGFRRQVVIGGRYIADFVAPREKLVVEIDGSAHVGRESRDRRRDRVLGRFGYRVLRLDAELVMRDLEQAVELIRKVLAAS